MASLPRVLGAQGAAAIAATRPVPAVDFTTVSLAPHTVSGRGGAYAMSTGKRRAVYILSGAVAGSVLLGGITAIQVSHCDDCIFAPVAVATGFAAGAVAGALVGWIVYEVRH